jgi:cytochrome c556
MLASGNPDVRTDPSTEVSIMNAFKRHPAAGWLALVALVVAVPALSMSRPPLAAQEPAVGDKPNDVALFMRAKLGHSQHVMEGLALADYDLIERGAHDLALASQASSWQVLQTEDYARQSREFRRACESLRAAAKDKNLDGAALAWMEVTLKCIQCHKYVRDVGVGN